MIRFITISEAKSQIHVTDTSLDEDIQLKCDIVNTLIYNQLNIADESPQTYPWTGLDLVPAGEFPYDLKAAALLAFAEMFVAREAGTANILSPAVMRCISKWRTPALG